MLSSQPMLWPCSVSPRTIYSIFRVKGQENIKKNYVQYLSRAQDYTRQYDGSITSLSTMGLFPRYLALRTQAGYVGSQCFIRLAVALEPEEPIPSYLLAKIVLVTLFDPSASSGNCVASFTFVCGVELECRLSRWIFRQKICQVDAGFPYRRVLLDL
jgi:hypothetical protein